MRKVHPPELVLKARMAPQWIEYRIRVEEGHVRITIELDLAPESLPADYRGQVGPQHLSATDQSSFRS